jgi:hypothetical protein
MFCAQEFGSESESIAELKRMKEGKGRKRVSITRYTEEGVDEEGIPFALTWLRSRTQSGAQSNWTNPHLCMLVEKESTKALREER